MKLWKRFTVVLAFLCAMLLLSGCTHALTYTEYGSIVTPNVQSWGEGYFTVYKSWGGGYRIVYANDTGVMYFVDSVGYAGGITPLYNADGSLQIAPGFEATK